MSSLLTIKAIARRELSAYFASPVAYVFIVIFLLITGFFTFMEGNFFERGQANLDAFFMWHSWLYLFLVPCVGMRLWAEERRVGTLELLLTKPLAPWQAILGKFIASWIFLALALALTFPVFITVNYLGTPDNGVIIAAYIGSFLMAGTYLAISCMTSAMTRNQVISFILSVVICLFLVLCGFPPVTNLLLRLDRPWLVELISSLSVMTHFQPFTTGIIDSRDVIFFLLVIAFALFTNGVIIRSHQHSRDDYRKRKTFESVLYSLGGVAAMFVVFVSLYIVSGAFNARFDITAEKTHTLSAGTKHILHHLDSKVTIRFYCSQSQNDMPPALRTYAHRVEDLLLEYQAEAARGHGQLVLQKLDPKPDSELEESAHLDGIEGRATGPFDSDKIYLGLVVSLLDEKFSLPFLAPERERLLEYDTSRALARVLEPSRPVVGIMSALPVWGDPPDPLMRPNPKRQDEWAFVTELKRDFTLKEIPLTTSKIDDDIQVLLVAHPTGITDAAQYALDQFVLRGGKLIAFVDPHAYFDQKHEASSSFAIGGDNAGRSSLDKLMKAWGYTMDVNHVTADTTYASRNTQTGDSMPTLLLVTRSGIDESDVATSQIDNLVMPFAGAFSGKPVEGLQQTVLVRSSVSAQLVDTLIASAPSERILQNFKPGNVELPLAMRLTGNFKTAFPAGAPRDPQAPHLTASTRSGEVVLVADTDMLNDKVCVRIQNVMGRPVINALNGNLFFVQSLVEQSTGNDDLISSRSRASMSRPFTRVKAMQDAAAKQWREKIQVLETQQRETELKIKELQAANSTGAQNTILTPAQEKALDDYHRSLAQVAKDLKQVRKNLRRDTDALEFWTKATNIAGMPAIIALSGICLATVKSRRRGAR